MPKRPALRHAFAIAVALILTALFLKGALPEVPSGTWNPAGSMAEVRAGASAVLLPDGRVLVTGGTGRSGESATAELFGTDGGFSAVAPMNTARSKHTSVVLKDGRVLVAGGIVPGGGTTNAAEIYDPTSNSWSSTAGSMIEARWGHTATLLKDGRVLIAGGLGNNTVNLSAEIYDPLVNRFSFAGSLSSPRSQHAAALLQDGRVFIIGGSDGTNSLSSTDLYDPIRGIVTPGPGLSSPRAGHSATALLNGDLLVAGGGNSRAGDLASAEIYDAATDSFAPLASGLSAPRRGQMAFLLPNNNGVLIVGGTSNGAALASAELYFPWAKTFQPTGSPSAARQGATGSPLKMDGLLLLAGGEGLASSELYGFASIKTDRDDYAPGEIVTITGAGWRPGETVTLALVESPLLDTHPTLTAVADARGKISNSAFSPDGHDIGIRFYVTATGASSQAQTTFTDDEPLPTVQFSATVSSGDESSTPADLAVSLSAVSGSPVTVHYSVTAGTATGGGLDYTLAPGTLTFNPGDTLLNIPIAITDDTLDELDENIVVSLHTPTNATLGTNTSHTYTIEDNDPRPTAQFFMTSSSGLENIASANLEVKLSTVSGKTVTVGYGVAGTATGGGVDYTHLGTGTLTFAPGQTSQSVPLSVVDDPFYEVDETVVATILFMTNANPGDNIVHTYTILNNDEQPTVQFALSNSSGFENITPANLAVALSAASSFTVNVNYAVTGGTATGGGVDYTLASGTLTFNPGDTSENIPLTVVNDVFNEAPETVVVTLSMPTNATLGGNSVHTFTIVDEDPAPTVQFTLLTSTGPESSTPINLEVKLSAVSGQTVTVPYSATGGTATGGGIDYTLPAGPLSFAPGVMILNIPLAINPDLLDEEDETVNVTLSPPTNATLGANTVHTYTILDDDLPPTISINDVSAAEGNSPGTTDFTFTVSLSAPSGRTVSVKYATADNTATTANSDYVGISATLLTFAPGETSKPVVVTVNGDNTDEDNETFFVSLTDLTFLAGMGNDIQGVGTITNDDQPPTVSINDVTMLEGNGSGTTPFGFTVSLSAASGKTITVKYASADGTATTADNDYVGIPLTMLTFAPGETSKPVVVMVNRDDTNEANETFFVNLSDLTHLAAMGNDLQGVGTINNEDPEPTVQFTLISSTGPETSTPINLEVKLSAVSGQTVTVAYAATGGTATGGADYTLPAGPLSFAPGVTVLNIPITVIDDSLDEDDETVEVTLSSPVNATLGAITVHTYTILDDDPMPTVSIDDVTHLEGNSPATTAFGFTVSLSAASGRTVTVKYATADNTATTADNDYVGIPATLLTFAPGDISKPVVVTVNGDNTYENDETFYVNLSYLTNLDSVGNDVQGIGTITNDDMRLTVTKTVINNNGGTKEISDFPLFVDGDPVTSGVPISLGAGAHTVSETGDPAYTATFGGDCDPNGIVTLNPGEAKTCTITNDDIERGTIIVEKQTVPHGVAGEFTFTGDAAGTISDGQQITVPNLLPGTYSSTETVPSGWDLTAIVCSDGNSTFDLGTHTATFHLEAGETVTCTFTDTRRAKIVVDKVTSPGGDPTNFTFTPTGFSGGTPFMLADGTTPFDSGTLVPGSYSVTETVPSGWDLTGLSCLSALGTSTFTTTSTPVAGPGSGGASITSLAAGDTVTCTFTDTRRAKLLVNKVTSPGGDPTEFTFTPSGFNSNNPFLLTDAATPFDSGTLVPGSYSVTETVPSGWDLTGLSCLSALGTSTFTTTSTPVAGPGSGGASITSLAAGDTVTCTFTDTKRATLLVNKVTSPGGDLTEFTFTPTGFSGGTPFMLADGTTPFDSGTLVPGSYSVTETVPSGWDLTGLSCLSALGTSTFTTTSTPVAGPGSGGASITSLAAGDTVTCTFTDTKRATLLVNKVTSPGGDLTEFTFTPTGFSGGTPFMLADGTTPFDSGTLVPGSYSVTETVPSGWDLTGLSCLSALGTSTFTTTSTPVAGPGSGGASITSLAAGDTVTCTFTDTKRAKLLVNKVTSPGGDPTEFTFTPSGFNSNNPFLLTDAATPFDSGTLVPGSYSVTETVPSGWDLTGIVCDDGNSTFNLGAHTATFHLEAGETVTCTFTDSRETGTIEVLKDLNPASDPGRFDLQIDGVDQKPNAGDGDTTGAKAVNTGTHTVGETGGTVPVTSLANYTSSISCVEAAAGGTNGASPIHSSGVGPLTVPVAEGDVWVCTITNTVVQVQAQLTVIKVVVNDNGGTKVVGDFPLFVDGGSVTSGVQNGFNAGPHTITETSAAGYAAMFSGDCAPNGTIMLSPGDAKTCTITNNDIAPQLIVIKHVVNNHDGTKDAYDFTMTVSGTAVPGGSTSFPGAESPGTTKVLKAGSYSVSEDGPSGYTSSFSANCSGSLALGQTKTCTVTNTAKKQSTVKLGNATTGNTTDHCDSNAPMGTRYVSGMQGGTALSMSVYVASPLAAGPNNQFQLAVYSDNANNPGTLVASTASGVLTANGWNTLSITATIAPNTAYWLFYNTNGTSCAVNNLRYTNSGGRSAWQKNVAFGTWPATVTPSGTSTVKATIYLTYVTGN